MNNKEDKEKNFTTNNTKKMDCRKKILSSCDSPFNFNIQGYLFADFYIR